MHRQCQPTLKWAVQPYNQDVVMSHLTEVTLTDFSNFRLGTANNLRGYFSPTSKIRASAML
jgi:hypothetical protein